MPDVDPIFLSNYLKLTIFWAVPILGVGVWAIWSSSVDRELMRKDLKDLGKRMDAYNGTGKHVEGMVEEIREILKEQATKKVTRKYKRKRTSNKSN